MQDLTLNTALQFQFLIKLINTSHSITISFPILFRFSISRFAVLVTQDKEKRKGNLSTNF